MADEIMGTQGQSYIVDHDTQYYFTPSLTIVHGRHTMQAGFQYEITLDNYAQSNIVSGSLGFTGTYTEDYCTASTPEFCTTTDGGTLPQKPQHQLTCICGLPDGLGAKPKQRGQPLLR